MPEYIGAMVEIEAEISSDDPEKCSIYCSFCNKEKNKYRCYLKNIFGFRDNGDIDVLKCDGQVDYWEETKDPGLHRTPLCLKMFKREKSLSFPSVPKKRKTVQRQK